MKVLTVLRPNVDYKGLDKTGSMHAALSLGTALKAKGVRVDYVANADILDSTVYKPDPEFKIRDYIKYSYRVYRDNNYDVIHFHIYTYTTLISEIYDSIVPSDKVVITLHVSPSIGRSAYVYQEVLYKLAMLPNVRFVSVGKRAVQDIMEKEYPEFPSHSYVINNGVDDYNLPLIPKDQRNGKIIIVGRCEPSKDIENILSFIVQYNLRCIYVGEEPIYIRKGALKDYITSVNKLINDNPYNIEWIHYLENKDLHKLMSECSALITFSRIECCCLSVLEAASVGTPVIYFDVMGISDIMKDGVTGILNKPDEVYRKSWTNKYKVVNENYLKALDLDPVVMSNYVKENFSYSSCADKYLKLYEEVCNNGEV